MVTYQFDANGRPATEVAFVTHRAADALQEGGRVRVRYLSDDRSVHRIDGEPGVLLLSFRLIVALALFLLFVVLLRGARSRPMLAIVFLPIAVASLAAQEQGPAFVIDLDISGGFIGTGLGGVTIASDGIVRASRGFGQNRESSRCRAKLAGAELERLQRAVAGATRQSWPATFTPAGDDGCCDRFKWTLGLKRQASDKAETFRTMWYDANERHLPKELAEIRDVAVDLLTRTLAACAKKSGKQKGA